MTHPNNHPNNNTSSQNLTKLPTKEYNNIKRLRQAISENNIKEIIKTYSPETDLSLKYKETTLLGQAINTKNFYSTKLLLDLGAPPDQTTKCISKNKSGICHRKHVQFETPLIIAINQNLERIFDELLTHGANTNLHGHMGILPIQIAAIKENPIIVRKLLSNGTQIKFPKYFNNPLSMVSQFLRHKIQICGFKDEHLISAKISLQPHQSNQREILTELIAAGVDNDLKGTDNLSPIMWCLKHADLGIIKLLIEAGAKPDINNPWLQRENLPIDWQQDPEIREWLLKEASTPHPLERLARISIRNHIKEISNKDIRLTASKLPLPEPLKLDLQLKKQIKEALSTAPSTPWADIKCPKNYWEGVWVEDQHYEVVNSMIPPQSTYKLIPSKTPLKIQIPKTQPHPNSPQSRTQATTYPEKNITKTYTQFHYPSSSLIARKIPPPILYYFEPKPRSNEHYFCSYNEF